MPKPKTDESNRIEATARLYAGMAGHDPDEAMKHEAGAKPAPAKKPKAAAKKAKR